MAEWAETAYGWLSPPTERPLACIESGFFVPDLTTQIVLDVSQLAVETVGRWVLCAVLFREVVDSKPAFKVVKNRCIPAVAISRNKIWISHCVCDTKIKIQEYKCLGFEIIKRVEEVVLLYYLNNFERILQVNIVNSTRNKTYHTLRYGGKRYCWILWIWPDSTPAAPGPLLLNCHRFN